MMAKYALKRTPCFSKLSNCDFRLYSAPNATVVITDPVQMIFQAKLREYREKSKNGEMVEPTPEMLDEYKRELERVNKQYGGDGNTDLTKFPEFKFPEVKLDPIVTETLKKEN